MKNIESAKKNLLEEKKKERWDKKSFLKKQEIA